MKISYCFLLLLFGVITLNAQTTLLPISNNPALEAYYQVHDPLPERNVKGSTTLEKVQCNIGDPSLNYLIAGQSGGFFIAIDTVDRGNEGIFICTNCDDLQYGSATIVGDSLVYTADMIPSVGTESVTVQFCKPDNSECFDSIRFDLVIKRAGRSFFPPVISIPAEAQTTVTATAAQLPGKLTCNFLIECEDDYEGQEQLVYFTNYSEPDSSLVYRAARYSGIDSVCLVLCDENTVCDTFHYAFRIAHDTLSLPFMDDFSYEGPLTNGKLWLDRSTFVNSTYAQDPPSAGVATFDGLDYRGRAYGGDAGKADRLTSTYINLSGVSGEPVLSYWLQRRGFGDKPEIQDSMLVEFKKSNGEWVRITAEKGAPNSQNIFTPEPFVFQSVVIPPAFRHKGFQFRFTGYADRQGARDNWHLDYIRLDTDNTEVNINDIAFTRKPEQILKHYSSMPWRHFQGTPENELAEEIAVGLYNHAAQPLNASPSTLNLVEINTGVNPFNGILTLLNGQEANVIQGTPINRNYDLSGDPNFPDVFAQYSQTMEGNSFDGVDNPEFLMTYILTNITQVKEPGYESIQRNDTIRQTTYFGEYFAYDDGTAEMALVTSEDTDVAVQFTAGVPDSLRAVRIHHPRTSIDVQDQIFQLRVWIGELAGNPDYSRDLNPLYTTTAFADTLQGFTTYLILDEEGNPAPLYLPEGNFYIGWRQVSSCNFINCVTVGYDRNRGAQAEDFAFQNSGQGWQSLDQAVPGALMIRPVVGNQVPDATATEEVAETGAWVKVYPNPARELLNLQLEDQQYDSYQYLLFNELGQKVMEGSLNPQIALGQLPAGMYLLKIYHRQRLRSFNQKVIITK